MLINPIHNSSRLCNSFIQGGHVGLLVHSTVVQFNMVIAPLTQHIPIFLPIKTVSCHQMIVTDKNIFNFCV